MTVSISEPKTSTTLFKSTKQQKLSVSVNSLGITPISNCLLYTGRVAIRAYLSDRPGVLKSKSFIKVSLSISNCVWENYIANLVTLKSLSFFFLANLNISFQLKREFGSLSHAQTVSSEKSLVEILGE